MKYQEWQAWQKDGAPADVAAWRANKPLTKERRKELTGITRNKLETSGFSQETVSRLSQSFEGLSDGKLQLIGNTIQDANLYEIDNGTSFHRGGSIYLEKMMPGETPAAYAERVKSMMAFYHEYGHYLDDRYGIAYDTDIMPAAENGANKFLQSIKGGKYSLVNGDIVRTSDNMIVGLGRSQDAEGMMKLQSDVTEHLNKSLGIKSRTELLKEMGYPVRPDFNEYFETYTTPKRQINRTRERYKGAQEAYTKAVGIDSELRDNTQQRLRTRFLRKNSALAREAHAFTDSIDAVTGGQMGMFFPMGRSYSRILCSTFYKQVKGNCRGV